MHIFRILTPGQLLFLALSLIATGFVGGALLLTDDIVKLLLVALVVSLSLYLGSKLALPASAHRMRTFRYAIWVFSGLFLAVAGLHQNLDRLVLGILKEAELDWLPTSLPSGTPSAVILFLAVIMYMATLFFLRDTGAVLPVATDPDLRTARYRDMRKAFVNNLSDNLSSVDEGLRWHHSGFISLDAEVDIRNKNFERRRVVDLITALKTNQQADLFVVVGVPGAGKSVALRKCCRDLLDINNISERIPIYINLKEWITTGAWTKESGPTDDDFADFVRENIRNRLPSNLYRFFDEHFDRMIEVGEIFFLFDSFDEIPGILDVDESSRLLKKTSEIVVRYLRGSALGRGIIASRYYRRPRLGQEVHVQLDVRPFSDRQIAKMIETCPQPDQLTHLLFRQRVDLGSIARNPFTLGLLIDYWRNNNCTAPGNQSDLYRSYIDQSLREAAKDIAKRGLTADEVRSAMEAISWEMFKSAGRGLEMSVRDLRQSLGNQEIDEILDILISVRLARKASRTQQISFVHRRFNEFFIVARWLSGDQQAPLEAIPADGRARDALVLYAEVANDGEAKRIANYCWSQISDDLKNGGGAGAIPLSTVYCLRFLAEAFRSRKVALADFVDQLSERVVQISSKSDDILLRKIAVETVGLLSDEGAEQTLVNALKTGNHWILETAISSCRFLTSLSERLEARFFQIIASSGAGRAIFPDRELMFTLTLSDVFQKVVKHLRIWQIDWTCLFLMGIGTILFLYIEYGQITVLLLFLLVQFVLLGADVIISAIFSVSKNYSNSEDIEIFDRKNPSFELGIEDYYKRLFPPLLFSSRNYTDWLILPILMFPLIVIFIFPTITRALDNVSDFSEVIGGAYISIPIIVLCLIFQIGCASFVAGLRKVTINDLNELFKIFLGALLKIKTILFIIVGIGLLLLFITMIHYLLTLVEDWLAYIGVGLLFCLIIPILILLFKNLYDLIIEYNQDRKYIIRATAKFIPRRMQIAQDFETLKTQHFKMKYVVWLQNVSSNPEFLLLLGKDNLTKNDWPDGGRPNDGDNEASSFLARLDGRWLDLEY